MWYGAFLGAASSGEFQSRRWGEPSHCLAIPHWVKYQMKMVARVEHGRKSRKGETHGLTQPDFVQAILRDNPLTIASVTPLGGQLVSRMALIIKTMSSLCAHRE